MSETEIRNVAIIAHVDHGKTTLLDRLLQQSGMFRAEELSKLAGDGDGNLVMDSNDLERERGITIVSKNCAIRYQSDDGREYKINLIDTPGHADFGGEVERVLEMADGVLLLVDAFEGPMPQTRFVLNKALSHKLKPVVVINKIDRPDARPDDVVNEVFDLLVELDAEDDALDFPIVYASAKQGWATCDLENAVPGKHPEDMKDVFQTIVKDIPAPKQVNAQDDPLQMMITSLDSSDYVGRIGIGKILAGKIAPGQEVITFDRDGEQKKQRVLKALTFDGLGRKEVDQVVAGDICAVVGLDPIGIGHTVADVDNPKALPPVAIDEPTLHVMFRVSDSPFAGREGDFVTSRQIATRLEKELRSNVAMQVKPGETPEQFHVSGRGLMHIGILIENMRREGFELSVGKPRVVFKEIDGKTHEPIERLVIDCPSESQSTVMSLLSDRRSEIVRIDPKSGTGDYVHMEFSVPARGLIGLRTRMLTATQGRAIMHNSLLGYEKMRGAIPSRAAGVIVASEPGQVTAYALDSLYDRGIFFVSPGDKVYEGQIVGEHCKDNDIVANVTRGKKLSNVRASGKDDAAQVRPPRIMSLESCLEFIEEDELVEFTPQSIRLRKRLLSESQRRKVSREAKAKAAA